MDGNVMVGAGFAIFGLYCVAMPGRAKLHMSLGRDTDRTNFDWMPDGGVRVLGGALVLFGAVIAKGWLFH